MNYYQVKEARDTLRSAFGPVAVLYQRLGPHAKHMLGTGGAQTHVCRCLQRADDRGLIVWEITHPRDALLAARSLRYMQHAESSGGYEQYLGTLGVIPPPAPAVQQALFGA